MRHNQLGFTLLEIAITMGVIGVLLSMVIKGQSMIDNSRAKSLAYDFKNIQISIYGYQDKFRALPGDDREASSHLPSPAMTIQNGNGNMIIGGNWNSTSGETFNFWQHVRLAGLIHGSTDISSESYVPFNASGGTLGVSEISAAPIIGLKGEHIICSDGIAGKSVKQLDIMLDDGNTNTGSVRASNKTVGGMGIATNNIVDSTLYLTCMGT